MLFHQWKRREVVTLLAGVAAAWPRLGVAELAGKPVVRIGVLLFGTPQTDPNFGAFRQGLSAREGALLSYGPDVDETTRRSAAYVDKILRGAKPGELPVEQPTRFQLVINGKTAKTLGLSIPDKLIALADEVIE